MLSNIKQYLKYIYQSNGIDIRVYVDGILAYSFCNSKFPNDNYNENFESVLRGSVSNFDKDIRIENTHAIYFGFVASKDKRTKIIVGPCSAFEMNRPAIARYLVKNFSEIYRTNELIDMVKNYISILPRSNIHKFAVLMAEINMILNEEELDPESLLSLNLATNENSLVSELFNKKININEIYDDVNDDATYYQKRKKLLFYLSNGMTNELKEAFANDKGLLFYGKHVNKYGDSERFIKDSLIIDIGLMCNTVLETGADVKNVTNILVAFLQKVESTTEMEKLNSIKYNAYLSFCDCVTTRQIEKTKYPIVNSIICYVNNNIEKRITLEEVAKKYKANMSYVSKAFKEATGYGFVEYVSAKKIKRAQELLLFTDMSLAEISSSLNFCSQSYFNNVFKKIIGKTPLEYKAYGER